MDLKSLAPRVYRAMLALDAAAGRGPRAAAQGTRPDPRLAAQRLRLLHRHAQHRRPQGGESEQRIYALPAWREAPYYTDRERAAFALTDAITLLSATHVPRDVYDEAAAQFTEPELAQLISLILTINAWNRIAVTTRLEPGT